MDGDTGRCEGAKAEKALPFPDTVHRSERSQAKAFARDNYNPERARRSSQMGVRKMADSLLKSDPSNLHQTDCTIDTTTASSVTTASAPDAGSSTTTAAAALTVTTGQADHAPGSTGTLTTTDVAVADTLEFSVAAINAGADADDFLAYDLSGTTAPWIVSDGGPGDLDGAANGTIVMNVRSAASACEQAFSRELLQPLTRDTALAAVPWLRSSAKTRH
jgi:hypothetical protein